ncbi:Rik1-associated factor 1 [Nannizzia gypsea CBS 118893]|uniref:Rik1-associated factor 1 n=1 Tax=Arthroderma gypseum (strain ATCC MYA-4604 / CBS 118893) TaxID=535722 RepID=E4UV51_ARTGP|nr:Rik1-associated factor 1 [Nannizzia gypsea CBS 118893]EFR01168.1 Rik1-associated factor 1 [Nannizzia gypsea CBS 118893]
MDSLPMELGKTSLPRRSARVLQNLLAAESDDDEYDDDPDVEAQRLLQQFLSPKELSLTSREPNPLKRKAEYLTDRQKSPFVVANSSPPIPEINSENHLTNEFPKTSSTTTEKIALDKNGNLESQLPGMIENDGSLDCTHNWPEEAINARDGCYTIPDGTSRTWALLPEATQCDDNNALQSGTSYVESSQSPCSHNTSWTLPSSVSLRSRSSASPGNPQHPIIPPKRPRGRPPGSLNMSKRNQDTTPRRRSRRERQQPHNYYAIPPGFADLEDNHEPEVPEESVELQFPPQIPSLARKRADTVTSRWIHRSRTSCILQELLSPQCLNGDDSLDPLPYIPTDERIYRSRLLSTGNKNRGIIFISHVDFSKSEMQTIYTLLCGDPMPEDETPIQDHLAKAIQFIDVKQLTERIRRLKYLDALLPPVFDADCLYLPQSEECDIVKGLQRRKASSILQFLLDGQSKTLSSIPSRLVVYPYPPSTPQVLASSDDKLPSALLRSRQLGLTHHRGRRPVNSTLRALRSRKWDLWKTWKGASHDVMVVSWAPDGTRFVAGTTTHCEDNNMQYNRNNNLLLGDLVTDSIRELPDHRCSQWSSTIYIPLVMTNNQSLGHTTSTGCKIAAQSESGPLCQTARTLVLSYINIQAIHPHHWPGAPALPAIEAPNVHIFAEWEMSLHISDIKWHPTKPMFIAGCSTPHSSTWTNARSIVRLYDPLRSKHEVSSFQCPALDINEVTFCPSDDNYITSSCTDNITYVWDRRNPSSILHKLGHGKPILQLDTSRTQEEDDTGVCFAAWSGSTFYTGGSDGVVKSWDTRRSTDDVIFEDIASFSHGVMSGKLSPDHTNMLIGDSGGSVHVLSTAPFSRRNGPDLTYHAAEVNAQVSDNDEESIAGILEARKFVASGGLTRHPVFGFGKGPLYKGPYATWARPPGISPDEIPHTPLEPYLQALQLNGPPTHQRQLLTPEKQETVYRNISLAWARNLQSVPGKPPRKARRLDQTVTPTASQRPQGYMKEVIEISSDEGDMDSRRRTRKLPLRSRTMLATSSPSRARYRNIKNKSRSPKKRVFIDLTGDDSDDDSFPSSSSISSYATCVLNQDQMPCKREEDDPEDDHWWPVSEDIAKFSL